MEENPILNRRVILYILLIILLLFVYREEDLAFAKSVRREHPVKTEDGDAKEEKDGE